MNKKNTAPYPLFARLAIPGEVVISSRVFKELLSALREEGSAAHQFLKELAPNDAVLMRQIAERIDELNATRDRRCREEFERRGAAHRGQQ